MTRGKEIIINREYMTMNSFNLIVILNNFGFAIFV